MGTGQANVKQYNRQLRNLIHCDKLQPGLIVSHELTLDQAPEGYQRFDNREDGWTKVILHPWPAKTEANPDGPLNQEQAG